MSARCPPLPGGVGHHHSPQGGAHTDDAWAPGPEWLVDPFGEEHASLLDGASGSLLGALRRHHLIHDFVHRDPGW